MILRRLAASAAVGLFAVSLTACGSGSSSDNSSGSSNERASLTPANFASSLSSAVKDQKSVHIEGKITAAGQALNMQADTAINGKNTQMKMSMDLGQLGTIQMMLADQVLYIKGSQVSQLASDPSKPWVKIDTRDTSNPLGSQLNKVFDQADPTKISDTFKAIKKLQKVGTETVHGVKATHYLVTIDTAAAVKAAGGDASKLGSAGAPTESKVNVWIDSQQRPVEMKLAIGSLAAADLTFTHWGDSVDVSVPPASQVSAIKGN